MQDSWEPEEHVSMQLITELEGRRPELFARKKKKAKRKAGRHNHTNMSNGGTPPRSGETVANSRSLGDKNSRLADGVKGKQHATAAV